MENVKLVKEIIQQNDVLTSIDLKDAYFSIPMCLEDQAYLCFSWENQCYTFTCLPFGLSSAPRIFTKVMKPVLAFARSEGIRLIIYSDDILIMASSEEESARHTNFVVHLLDSLGFIVNREKSCLLPQSQLTYLGFEIDSKSMTISVPKTKVEKLKCEGSQILTKKVVTIRQLAKFIGLIVSTFDAFPQARLHFRKLEFAKTEALQREHGNFDAKISIQADVQQEIHWWLALPSDKAKSFIKTPSIDVVLSTHASNEGWGAVSESDNAYAQGKWSKTQQLLHINMLELLAAQNALLSLCGNLTDAHVLIKSDNTTTVAYISKMGGAVPPLNALAISIHNWCVERNIHLSATHIAGVKNVIADSLSRKELNKELCIQSHLFDRIVTKTIYPDIDLFASHTNHQLECYVSWKADPYAWAIDAFSLSWSDMTPYIFPPFCLLSRILDKIYRDRTPVCLLIAPLWKAQPWFPRLLQMLIANPIKLLEKCLVPQAHQLLVPNLHLAAWVISGNSGKQRAFQMGLPISSQIHGNHELKNSTSPH